jgi:hypothetical protein
VRAGHRRDQAMRASHSLGRGEAEAELIILHACVLKPHGKPDPLEFVSS